jgi:murein DD-endopeptidase MepM/ murein hydrolase activator NlpD
MKGRHTELLQRRALAVIERLSPFGPAAARAGALTFVLFTALLALGARLPFPPPGIPVLYQPTDWSLLFAASRDDGQTRLPAAAAGPAVGGLSTEQPPVAFLRYRVQPGDTMSSVSTKLGVSLDTLSSLNRAGGRGVHSLTVGEILQVPTEDGIRVVLDKDFDAFAATYKDTVAPEEILAANGLTRDQLVKGMTLFLPRVQDKGAALMQNTGAWVGKPLPYFYESSRFGTRQDPFTGAVGHHSGVDLAAPMGTPIYSATGGTVEVARYDSLLGNYVQIRSLGIYTYVYGHMSQIRTHVGARVRQGDVIGLVGSTGYATGPHLHFEVRKNGIPQNPRLYLAGVR